MLGNFPKVTQLVSNRTGTRILIFSLSLFFNSKPLTPSFLLPFRGSGKLPKALQQHRVWVHEPPFSLPSLPLLLFGV